MKISKAVERGAFPDRGGVDDLRKGKRGERSPGTLAQWWPAERPPGHLVISNLQIAAHVRGHRGDLDLAGLLLVASPIALLLAGWWWGVR